MKKFIYTALALIFITYSNANENINILPENILLVYNSKVKKSEKIALHYAKLRSIPKKNLLDLQFSKFSETITDSQYQILIANPIATKLISLGWMQKNPKKSLLKYNYSFLNKTKPKVITLFYGIPLRVKRSNNQNSNNSMPFIEYNHNLEQLQIFNPFTQDPKNNQNQFIINYEIIPQILNQNSASVDSEISAIPLTPYTQNGPIPNPYFIYAKKMSQSLNLIIPTTPPLIVFRLDGPKPQHVKKIIDDSIYAEKNPLLGWAYFDLAKHYEIGEIWLKNSAKLTAKVGIPTDVNYKKQQFHPLYPTKNTILYFGWYSQIPKGKFANTPLARGAIASHIHSFSAISLKDTKNNWSARLIKNGSAVTLGNTFEPTLAGTTNILAFITHIISQKNIAQSYIKSTPFISWMNTIIADPLYTPFKNLPNLKNSPINSKNEELVNLRQFALKNIYKQNLYNNKKEINQKNPTKLEALAHYAILNEKFEIAENFINSAINIYPKKSPDSLRAYLTLAKIHSQKNDHNLAHEILTQLKNTFTKKNDQNLISYHLIQTKQFLENDRN